ncbi:hypothetical protein [Peribacillus butanolivorans]|nr:hypothetical protein [Peribacillus butanolivorans]QNU04013.1 hypothetical protein GM240_08700 [Peribacillus butanolivorans]
MLKRIAQRFGSKKGLGCIKKEPGFLKFYEYAPIHWKKQLVGFWIQD